MPNINKNIIMQAGAAVANATNKAAGLYASIPEPGSIISAIQLVNGGRTIGPAALAHFTESVRNKLLSLLVDLEPIQSGSGTPSPDNVRPISGRTGLNIYVSPTQDVADATTYNVDWTSEAGTVYGGTLDVVTGVLTVTMAKSAVLASGLLNNGSAGDRYQVFYHVVGRAYTRNVICNYFVQGSDNPNYYVARTNGDGIEFSLQNSLIGVQTSDDDNTVKLPAAKAWFTQNNVELCYELATPLTYQLTPQDIITLVGDNYIWSDSGDVTITE